jgi:hypothetical protein
VQFFDIAFSLADRPAMTVVHEMGHNWNEADVRWIDWLDISGWTLIQPTGPDAGQYEQYRYPDGRLSPWWHLRANLFAAPFYARKYGEATPHEDWTTAWESYFAHGRGLPNVEQTDKLPAIKRAHLDEFFNRLTR